MGRIVLPFYDSYGVYSVPSYFRLSYFPLYRLLQPLLRLGLLKQAELSSSAHRLGVTLARQGLRGRAVNYQEGILIKFFMVVGRLQLEGLT